MIAFAQREDGHDTERPFGFAKPEGSEGSYGTLTHVEVVEVNFGGGGVVAPSENADVAARVIRIFHGLDQCAVHVKRDRSIDALGADVVFVCLKCDLAGLRPFAAARQEIILLPFVLDDGVKTIGVNAGVIVIVFVHVIADHAKRGVGGAGCFLHRHFDLHVLKCASAGVAPHIPLGLVEFHHVLAARVIHFRAVAVERVPTTAGIGEVVGEERDQRRRRGQRRFQ